MRQLLLNKIIKKKSVFPLGLSMSELLLYIERQKIAWNKVYYINISKVKLQ